MAYIFDLIQPWTMINTRAQTSIIIKKNFLCSYLFIYFLICLNKTLTLKSSDLILTFETLSWRDLLITAETKLAASYPDQCHGGYIWDSVSLWFLPGEALILAERVGHSPIFVLICCWKSKSHDCLKVTWLIFLFHITLYNCDRCVFLCYFHSEIIILKEYIDVLG